MSTNMNSGKQQKAAGLMSVGSLTIMAMLGGVSVVLMLLDFPLWFAPPFYKLDFSEVPVLIGAFALGPAAGIVIELIKILLNLVINFTETAGVGEAANFIIGCSMVVPAAVIYYRNKKLKSAIIGLISGTLCMTVIGGLMNAFVLLPAYAYFFKMPIDSIIGMGTKVNSAIDSMATFVFYAVTPFNLFKGVSVSIITLLLYKRLSRIIKVILER